MAFTADSKVQVRKYLGYPFASSALDATLDALDSSAANEVAAILDELADVESRLAGYARDVAGIARVNTLEFASGMAIADLEHLGNGLAQRLSNALGVEVRAFPFGLGTQRGPGALFFGA